MSEYKVPRHYDLLIGSLKLSCSTLPGVLGHHVTLCFDKLPFSFFSSLVFLLIFASTAVFKQLSYILVLFDCVGIVFCLIYNSFPFVLCSLTTFSDSEISKGVICGIISPVAATTTSITKKAIF